jgi:hypothetical protein
MQRSNPAPVIGFFALAKWLSDLLWKPSRIHFMIGPNKALEDDEHKTDSLQINREEGSGPFINPKERYFE